MAIDSFLEKTLLELRAEIARREAELQLLKSQFKTLDDARVILVAKAPPGQEAISQLQALAFPEKERGLQDVVLDYLRAAPNPDGVSIKEVSDALRKDFAPRYNGKNSYASSIYVTLRRLVEQGKARVRDIGEGKRWFATDSTMSIFEE